MLGLVPFGLAKKNYFSREKLDPFECGFRPSVKARTPFSFRFFLLTVLFLVFDVEVIILVPTAALDFYSINITSTGVLAIFLVVLRLGLAHEWAQGHFFWAS